MCSIAGQSGRAEARLPDFAARLATAIDECAAAVSGRYDPAAADTAARLAAAWALVTSADPGLAARIACYSDLPAGSAPGRAPGPAAAAADPESASAGGDLDVKPGAHLRVQPN